MHELGYWSQVERVVRGADLDGEAGGGADAGVPGDRPPVGIDEGGDLGEATGHLLRAWLRAPEDGRVIYDLARAYAGRGDGGRALELLAAGGEAGFAVGESAAGEPLFEVRR